MSVSAPFAVARASRASAGQQGDLDQRDDAAQQVGRDADPRLQLVFDVDRCRAEAWGGPAAGPAAAASPYDRFTGPLARQGRPARSAVPRRNWPGAPQARDGLRPGAHPAQSQEYPVRHVRYRTGRTSRHLSRGRSQGPRSGVGSRPRGLRPAAAGELLVERDGVGVWLAVGGDVRHRVQAAAPRLADPGEIARPRARRASALATAARRHTSPASPVLAARAEADGSPRRELELGEQLGRIDDLSAHGLGEGQVQPPVVAAGERLAADQRQRVPQAAAVSDVRPRSLSSSKSAQSSLASGAARTGRPRDARSTPGPRRPGRAACGCARSAGAASRSASDGPGSAPSR